MVLPDNSLLFLVMGALSGVLSGLFGVGAGIILVPALVLMSTPQKEAQGMSLAVMVPMALLGALRYKANPELSIDLGIAAVVAGGALVGVLAGTSLANAGWMTGILLRRMFAVFLIAVAVRLLVTKGA